LPEPAHEATTRGCDASDVRREKQHQKRLTSEEVNRLTQDRRAGMTIMELADRYGIHRTTVMNHIKPHR
jgi:hypothetical protein